MSYRPLQLVFFFFLLRIRRPPSSAPLYSSAASDVYKRQDRDYEERPDRDSEQYEETAFRYGTGSAEENPTLRVDLDYGADLVRGAVRLGRAVEQMTDDAPQREIMYNNLRKLETA